MLGLAAHSVQWGEKTELWQVNILNIFQTQTLFGGFLHMSFSNAEQRKIDMHWQPGLILGKHSFVTPFGVSYRWKWCNFVSVWDAFFYIWINFSPLSPFSLTLNTGVPQGCVFSPLLHSLYNYNCVTTLDSKIIIKFANDKAVAGLISNNPKPIGPRSTT